MRIAGVILALAACTGGGAATVTRPAGPVAATADDLGSIRPLPYRKQLLVHLDAEAKRAHEAGDLMACGQRYVDLYNRATDGPQAEQLLFNAAECYAGARSAGVAVTLRRSLIDKFPRSRFVADSMLAIAQTYAGIAYYDEAAAAYVRYAVRFAAHADAPQALAIAVRYRLALDDASGAAAIADRFAASYGRTLPAEAARLHLATAAAYARPEQRARLIERLEAFLRRHPHAPLAAQVEARVRLGRALLHRSCPVEATLGDACVVIESLPPQPRRRAAGELPTACGPRARTRWQMHDRDPALLRRARAILAEAQALWERGQAAVPAAERTALDYWAAAGRFAEAELVLEDFQRTPWPADLDFSPPRAKASQARVQAYVAARRAVGLRAEKAYGRVLGFGSTGLFWGMRVAARRADLRLRFLDSFMQAPIPAQVRTGAYAEDTIDAYCDALTQIAEPIEAKAMGALRSCVELATGVGWYDAWSRRCHAEMTDYLPTEHPAFEEMYAAADRDGAAPSRARSRAEAQAFVDAEPKALLPRLEFGALLLAELRRTDDRAAAARLIEDARRQLSSALAIAPDDVRARVLLALVYMAGAEDNAARLALARLLLDEAEVSSRSPLVANARGVVLAARGQLADAVAAFADAIERDPEQVTARLNAGSAALALRRWPEAEQHFRAALERTADSYDAHIGLGVALRAQGDLAGAERSYRAAAALDATRPEAPFDLAVLIFDFRANQHTDLNVVLVDYRRAIPLFEQALASPHLGAAARADVERRLALAHKTIATVDEYLRAQPAKPVP